MPSTTVMLVGEVGGATELDALGVLGALEDVAAAVALTVGATVALAATGVVAALVAPVLSG